MTLRLVFPNGTEKYECDDVTFFTLDGKNGKNGGSIGIRENHEKAIMAIAEGEFKAMKNGKTVFSRTLKGGIASVENNVVTVISE